MKKNRVLIITPGMLPVPAVKGGAVETLAETLARQNERHQKMQLTIIGQWDARAKNAAEKYKHTKFEFVRLPWKYAIADFGIYSYMEYIKKDWKSMFHQNHYREKYYIQKVAKYLHEHDFDRVVFENRLSLLSALGYYGNGEKYAGKYDYHQHSAVLGTGENRDYFVKSRKIQAVSEYVREDILRNYPETAPGQVVTVKNGVNRRKFGRGLDVKRRAQTRRQLQLEDETMFFYSGRLSQEKGVLEMIRAFQEAVGDSRQKARLFIAGGCFSGKRQKNAYYRKILDEIKGWETSIQLLGFLPYHKMNDYYEAADVLLIPTVVPDAAPLTLLEGMMSPAAVLASSVGGIPEYAGERGAALVSMDGEAEGIGSMTAAIRRCIQEPGWIEKCAREGRRWGRQFTCRSYYENSVAALGIEGGTRFFHNGALALGSSDEPKEVQNNSAGAGASREKPIAFLGTGRYAAAAVEYFKGEEIGCFVNFSPSCHAKELLGYPVIEAAEFYAHAAEYRLVLISTFQNAIVNKLNKQGITEYTYYSPGYEEAMQELARSGAKVIGVYGGENAGFFCRDIQARTGAEVRQLPGENDLEGGISKIHALDAILIGDGTRHAALAARAMREKAGHTIVVNPFRQVRQFATDALVVNPYGDGSGHRSEQEWNRQQQEHGKRDEIHAFVEEVHGRVPLFEMIEIETVNQCNGSCAFCPVNHSADTRKRQEMGMKLFQKIILDLQEISYQGHVALFSNNEPFLDPTIEEKAAFARQQLPKAKLHIFTNGTVLTLERFLKIIPFLDELVIDNYSRDLKLHANSRAIKEYCEGRPELKEKVTIVIRDPMEVLTTRGGDAPNRKEKLSYPGQRCALPFQQMVVRPDGKLSLCCNDPLGKETLGDLNRQSVWEAWHSQEYEKVREEIYQGRECREHCRYCDTFDLY